MLQGEKIRLRAYDSRDNAQEVLELINNEEVLFNTRPTTPYPFTFKDEENFLGSQSALNNIYNFAIERLSDGQYLGGCGINNLDLKNSKCIVGIFLAKDFWNMGYGTDAMKALVHFIFGQIPVNKISLHVFSFNSRAIRSYEKFGFVKEAVLKEELFRNGKYHDTIIMSIFRRDYDETF